MWKPNKFKTEYLALIISVFALIFSTCSSCRVDRHNDRIIELESMKMFLEFGTLETVALGKENLRKEWQDRRTEISKKWYKELGKKRAEYSKMGLSGSGFMETMEQEIMASRSREILAEERKFNLEMLKLDEKEKLIIAKMNY